MPDQYLPKALRKLVHHRANERCEYCRLPEAYALVAHQVDHIVAVKHGGATNAGSLALCCARCNRHKGSDLTTVDPETGEVTLLFNPRVHAWADHFSLDGPILVPLTPIARGTLKILRLNEESRVEERRLLLDLGEF